MTKPVLHKTIFLKATRETVWQYLTEPAFLEQWFHAPKTPLTVGAEFEMFGRESGDLLVWGTVLDARPPEYLEHSFTVKPMGGAESVVKWHLEERPGGTRLTLEHHGLPETIEGFDLLMALDKGWDSHFSELRAAVHGAA